MSKTAIHNGWRLTFAISVLVSCITLPILFLGGLHQDTIGMFLRTTARCSVILFLLAFSASAAVQLFPNAFTRRLARNRRYIGVSFAFSHTLHLGGIVTLIRMKPDTFSNTAGVVTLIGGGLAFVFLYAMVATSFDRTAAWLGARRWKILHKSGMYYFFMIFLLDYIPLSFESPFYIPFAILVVGAFVLRMMAWRRLRRRVAAYS